MRTSIMMALILLSAFATLSESQLFCNTAQFKNGSARARNVDAILTRLQNKAKASIGDVVKDHLAHPNVFGEATCKAGISEEQCDLCFKTAVGFINKLCPRTIGVRALTAGKTCTIRYEPVEIKN